MAISRAVLLKELMPGLNKLFSDAYGKHSQVIDTGWFESYYIIQKGNKYQVWLCGQSRKKLVANNLKQYDGALALIKLLNTTKEES
jgi:hypothetical protein